MLGLLDGVAIAAVILLVFSPVPNVEDTKSLFVAANKQVGMIKKTLLTEYFPLHSIREIENFANNRAKVIVTEESFQGYDSLQIVVSPEHESIGPNNTSPSPEACDGCTFLNIPTAQPFRNGAIEVDIASTIPENAPPSARGFIGIMFRVDAEYTPNGEIDAKNSRYEGIYLRPANSKANNQRRRNSSVQYISNPGYPWYVLRRNSPGLYETYAPLELGRWTRMRIEVEGTSARLYLNGSLEPTLLVNDLKQGEQLQGAIGLYTEPQTIAYFKNLKVTHY